MNAETIIDAKDSSLGRVASFAAKQALLGRKVAVVNCSEALILGKRNSVLEKYKNARSRGGTILKGPNFPRSPERITKRTVRGMLRYKRGRGAEALKKVRCYNETPEEYINSQKISLKRDIRANFLKLSELSRLI